MALLEIQDLHATVDGHEILKGMNLTVNAGEVHSIMGPNGSGKSTLAQVLARRETYEVTGGRVLFNGKDLLEMKPEEAACEGVFLAFQYPVEIPGIGNAYFLRSALNAIRKYHGQDELDAMDFLPLYKERMKLLEMDEKLMNRSVNEGFSGGEKKRNEILQMAMLEPKLAILDETDSGLDIDALRIVAQGVNAMRSPDRAFLVVTHYQRLLDYIAPDFVHVLVDGKIVRSGGPELALELEEKGYGATEAERGFARMIGSERHEKRERNGDTALESRIPILKLWRTDRPAAGPRRPQCGCGNCARTRVRASATPGFPPRTTKTGASPIVAR